MEKNNTKKLVILSLVVSILGLSLGFAAFSQTLTIKSSAEVNPNAGVFNVDFSSSSSSVVDDAIVPTLSPNNVSGFTATSATIDNSDADNPVIKNLHAVFTAPGQSATYSFYTKNTGELTAYLTGITFNNVNNTNQTKQCTAKVSSAQSSVDTYCQGIKLKVVLGSEEFSSTKTRNQFSTATAHDLQKNGYETINVIIMYEEGSTQAGEAFDVDFGDVVLSYSSNV